ncbi:unnamed protein product [Phytophthora fragariaefolia]|uniref:Unnamed protein product n=1 Tax=Phytophthora fragariaefolia TaxID=1490495 RepID=A0A9W7D8C4_9STRA|nr:unnamed protein product [Phytophthora fragariaefolia]
MDAGVTLENDPSTGHAPHVAAKGTQCTFAANAANSAGKCTTWAGVSCSNVTNDWPTLLPRTSINPSDLYNSLAKLPGEVVVPLIKSQNSADDPRGGLQVTDGPTETICLPGRLTTEFRIRRRQPAESTHELWVRRTKDWIPMVVLNRSGRATRVLLNSVKTSLTWCPAHFPVLNWTPHGVLPPEGFIRLSSAKYRDWQALPSPDEDRAADAPLGGVSNSTDQGRRCSPPSS